jgi:hypothetical protein
MTSGEQPENHRVNDTQVTDSGELEYWDGSKWVPHEYPPDLPGGDPSPLWMSRDA